MGVVELSRPFGTHLAFIIDPGVETPGYCQSSLRDAGSSAGGRREHMVRPSLVNPTLLNFKPSNGHSQPLDLGMAFSFP